MNYKAFEGVELIKTAYYNDLNNSKILLDTQLAGYDIFGAQPDILPGFEDHPDCYSVFGGQTYANPALGRPTETNNLFGGYTGNSPVLTNPMSVLPAFNGQQGILPTFEGKPSILPCIEENPSILPFAGGRHSTTPAVGTRKYTEETLLALMGETGSVLDFFENDPDDISINGRAAQRSNERRREKQDQFQKERKRHCDRIDHAYDCYVEAEYAYESFRNPEESPVEYLRLKNNYDKSVKHLESVLYEYTHMVSNSAANYVLNKVNNIIYDMLKSDQRSEYFNNPKTSFTRERLISLEDLMYYLMTLKRGSGNKELFDFFWDCEDYIPSAAAMNQQRHNLKPEGVKHIFTTLAQELSRIQKPTYKNRRILGVDGTDTDTWYDETAENFMEGHNGKKGFNQNHLVTIHDVLSGVIIDCVIQPRPKTNETKAATEMVKRHKLFGHLMLLADRGFASFNLIETCRLNGIDCCFRIREDFCKESKNMPLAEGDVDFTTTIFTRQTKENKAKIDAGLGRYLSGASPYGKNKKSQTWDYGDNYTMTFRIVRFEIGKNADGTSIWETMITTLPRSEFSLEEIKEIYRLRWAGVEGAYRDLKYSGNLSFYHSKLPEFTEQETYARLTMYNICRVIMNIAVYGPKMADREFDVMARAASTKQCTDGGSENDEKSATTQDNNDENNKENAVKDKNSKKKIHDYQINHTMAFYIIFDFVRNKGDVPYDVCNMINKYMLPIRYDRVFERNIRPQSFISFLYR